MMMNIGWWAANPHIMVISAVAVYVSLVSAYHFSLRRDFGPLIEKSKVPLGILVCGILLIALAVFSLGT
jgi:hypothetical protein